LKAAALLFVFTPFSSPQVVCCKLMVFVFCTVHSTEAILVFDFLFIFDFVVSVIFKNGGNIFVIKIFLNSWSLCVLIEAFIDLNGSRNEPLA